MSLENLIVLFLFPILGAVKMPEIEESIPAT